ncbi:aldose 1-epimerase family protein [Bombilactobacillus bombi]|uniref:aldose 1-epimerase family protein n=1 Tax=Bombilactobacillus bombi TaxID=1303590 RepID=UPI0015E61BCC|nr:aldose 1-epimerase family protein [Bombilactobacillus bombi]MBA1434548.1 aldose 1-epimerase family protein [Bombilactobacillus bombi]
MQIIENKSFKAEIDEKGAQLTHLYKKGVDFDYIWNNNLWPKHAPVLFPAIGRSNDESYLYKGQSYQMPQHGFVSDYDFEVIAKQTDSVTLQLMATKETKILYPFNFKLAITFRLTDLGLHLSFKVTNNDTKTMSFSLGSHPAFNVPIDEQGEFSDYQIVITPKIDQLNQFDIIKKPYPFRSGSKSLVPNYHNGIIDLNYDMFAKGLIILENYGIESLKLRSDKSKHSIKLSLKDFRYVCLWTKEDANAPFLCIEPFEGLPDIYGYPIDLMEKPDNDILLANNSKVLAYDINLK